MSRLVWDVAASTLGMETTVTVALPDARPHHSLILLHGLTGDHSVWSRRVDLETIANRYRTAIFMPSGARSFWVNERFGLHYRDWVATELPELASATFQAPAVDLIAGLSMGGFGAFHAALSAPGTFRAAGSFSGTLDINEPAFQGRHPDTFANSFHCDGAGNGAEELFTPLRDLARGGSGRLRLWASIGTEDRLLAQNRRFQAAATDLGIDLTYREGPGDHTWERWARDLPDFLAWATA